MIRKIQPLLILCMFLLLIGCREETIEPETFGSVFGEVIEEGGSNLGVLDAKVTTNPPTSSVLTDNLGRFSFEDIETGTYTIRVEKDGYTTELETVTVNDNNPTNVVITLNVDTMVNTLPEPPMNIAPANGVMDISVNPLLSWTAMDADPSDQLRYDVELFNADQSESIMVLTSSVDTFIQLQDLKYNTVYRWQVRVSDNRGEPVYSEVWSFRTEAFPDHRFLFARQINGKYDIYSSDMEGNYLQLTDRSGSSWRPKMSPQRDKIAFIGATGTEAQIYLMDRDGTNQRQLTTIPISGYNNFQLNFSFSPDGSKILYMNNSRLYSLNIDGTGLQYVAEAPAGFTFTECDWTAQGNFILARTTGINSYQSFVYILDTNGTYISLAINDDPGATGGGMFSITGDEVLYTYDVTGFETTDGRRLDTRIFTKNLLNTAQVTDISIEKPNGTNDVDARYSPDGSKVIFVNTNNDGISQKNIWIMDIDGDNRELLFENAEMPEWK